MQTNSGKMSLERMREIHRAAMASFGNYRGHMTVAERMEVINVWNADPSGHASFASTFRRIMETLEAQYGE